MGVASPHKRDNSQYFYTVASLNTEYRDRLEKMCLQMVGVRGCRLKFDIYFISETQPYTLISPQVYLLLWNSFLWVKILSFQSLIYAYSLLKS